MATTEIPSQQAIDLARALGPARRSRPGCVPLDLRAEARRDRLPPPAARTLRHLTRRAHYGRTGGLDLSGLVYVESVPWLAGRLRVSPATLHRHLAVLIDQGFLAWAVRPSRSRPGVLQVLDYPRRKPAAQALQALPVPSPQVREVSHSCAGSDRAPVVERARLSSGRGDQQRPSTIQAPPTLCNGRAAGRGACRREDALRSRPPAAALLHVQTAELRDPAALRRRHREAAAAGLLPAGEAGLLQLAAAAQHALRVGRDACAVLASNVRSRRDHAAAEDEERARRLLAADRDRPPPGPPSDTGPFPAEDGGPPPDFAALKRQLADAMRPPVPADARSGDGRGVERRALEALERRAEAAAELVRQYPDQLAFKSRARELRQQLATAQAHDHTAVRRPTTAAA